MFPYMVNFKVSARTLTGALNAHNKAAVDWGWQGLIAYGCHSLVVVIDSSTAQTLQVLEKHKADVVKVKWARENYHHNIGSPYSLRLASADVNGKIIIWDVAAGVAQCEIQEHAKPIQDVQWLWNQDASRDLLLAIHPPNYIVLWNADTGTKLWKKSYADNILSFSFDPFDPSHLTLLTSEGIVFISDFSPSKPPSGPGKKVYISSPHSSPAHSKLAAATGAKKALNKVKILITQEKPSAEFITLNDCLQLAYLPSKRNHMLLLYPREILILDLEVNQTVGVIAIERTGVPFLQKTVLSSDPDPVQELTYDLRSQCDAIRVTKTVRPFSMVCCPVNENAAALVEVHLKFLLTGLLSGLPSPQFAIRMCPPLTTKNIKMYQPLLAVGTGNGSVLVYHLTSGLLHKELSIHSCEVRQYLAVVFKDKPLELWDVRTCTILREMSKNFPAITALEWSPSHNLKSLRKKQLATREAMARQTVVSDTELSVVESSVISLLQEAESKSELSQNISAREHFVFTDTDGQVYHLTVEGNSVKDSARIPPDGSMGSITCIAWKGDTLVLGDMDGNLNFWDLKGRVSRGIPTHRSWVRKIRFAPGKGNQKLIAMYNDGAEVWDTKEVQMVSSLRSGRNVTFRILDVDWCTSDKVILASDDGCIRVLEMSMKSTCFRMDEQELTGLRCEFSGHFGFLLVRLYGDESELHFWTVAAHYLHSLSQEKAVRTPAAEEAAPREDRANNPLDICYDILCENAYFQTDRAVQLLLETSADNQHYYCDSLKACLVTTVTSSGPSQSTIKLVATNMIANGKLAEGVQLLCLIDKAADACRYLQTYGEWNRAAWLAKVRLNSEECADVLKRWVDHLCSPQVNQKSKALLVLLSLGCFSSVAETLHSMRYFDRAALFVEACIKYGAIEVSEDTDILCWVVRAEQGACASLIVFRSWRIWQDVSCSSTKRSSFGLSWCKCSGVTFGSIASPS
ncbi:WD repeat-containing protein 11 [Camelus ferus]|nr:WD repeat-containing protein 11 [Camelus ferus]